MDETSDDSALSEAEFELISQDSDASRKWTAWIEGRDGWGGDSFVYTVNRAKEQLDLYFSFSPQLDSTSRHLIMDLIAESQSRSWALVSDIDRSRRGDPTRGLNHLDLRRLSDLSAECPPPPWDIGISSDEPVCVRFVVRGEQVTLHITQDLEPIDAALLRRIVALRNALPQLLRELEASTAG